MHQSGARGGGDFVALACDGDSTVVSDAHALATAPDVVPPGASFAGPQRVALAAFGPLPGSLRCLVEFTVVFCAVVMLAQLLKQLVGGLDPGDAFGGKERWQAVLPVVMQAFYFTFGLWGGRVLQADAVKVEGSAQLGERIGGVGVEEAVIVDIQGEGQAVLQEGPGQDVVVAGKHFALVEACPDDDA